MRSKGDVKSGMTPEDYSEGAIVDGDPLTVNPDGNGNPVIQVVSSSQTRSSCTEHLFCGFAKSDSPFDTMNPDKGFGSKDDPKTWGGGVAASASGAVTRKRPVSFNTSYEMWVQAGTSSGAVSDVTGSGTDFSRISIGDTVRPYSWGTADSATGRHGGVRYCNPATAVFTTSAALLSSASLRTTSQVEAFTVSVLTDDGDRIPSTARGVILEVRMVATASGQGDTWYFAPTQALATTSNNRKDEVVIQGDAAGDAFTHEIHVELDSNGAFWTSASAADTGFTGSIKLKGFSEDKRVFAGVVYDKKVLEDDDDNYWGEVLVQPDQHS